MADHHDKTQLNQLMAQIEEMWRHLGLLFDELEAEDGWGQKHGPDWTFADVPFHLAYCNEDIVARGLELGPDYPEQERELLATGEELGGWNARHFADRPSEQTAAQSVAQWRDSCEKIRHLVAQMSDEDLDTPFWMPLFLGWTTKRAGLEFVCRHDWSEFTQLRIHMGRSEPVPSPDITRSYLGSMLGFFLLMLNREAAAGRVFTAVMAFTDPGVGSFTLEVADGTVIVKEGSASNPDLQITQSAETFESTMRGIRDPMAAIESGQVQVNDLEALATFGQLFPTG